MFFHILRSLFNSIAFYFSHRLVCPDTLVVYIYACMFKYFRNLQEHSAKLVHTYVHHYTYTYSPFRHCLASNKVWEFDFLLCIFAFYSCNHYRHVCYDLLKFFYMTVALLDELNSVRLHIQTEKHTASPCMLVHCSTGVGRSGVVMLSDVMRKCLENNEVCQNRILSVWIVRLSS